VHKGGKTVNNTIKNLKALEDRIGSKAEIYLGEAIKKIKWPVKKVDKDCKIKFS